MEIYMKLAGHLENLVMGYPFNEALLKLLQEMFTPAEARIALAIPNNLAPFKTADLETIIARSDLPRPTVEEGLESLSKRHLIYSTVDSNQKEAYALLQVGYGMPQTFFWEGRKDDTAKRMAKLVLNYFTIPTTQKIYGGVATKNYKYSPANMSIDIPMQGVMPYEQMGPIVSAATKIAVAHCPCRMSAHVLGRTDCPHSLEVCFKYNELAEFLIAKGLGREVSKDEALHTLGNCEKEGLVHMVDNAQGEVKHTCNCCGHYCWNVGIIRRKKIPRDALMAVYFTRETNIEECIGCGACQDICPVDASVVVEGHAEVDLDWCIGCGVCAVTCPTGAISLKRRTEEQSPESFSELHQRIKQERGLV
ncbi:MAG: 4Fe-4S binding protein [Desulfobacterales bacterium]|jgi:ferredoxin|nr:4Fe-4S binding protein [Desulfobacterales bacterium]